MEDEVILARTGLLDALDALAPHLDAVVLVGAQAVYLHTGEAEVALAEYTTDADIAFDPELLGIDPLIEAAMRGAGFMPDSRQEAVGSWVSPSGVGVDLMVPDAVAGAGKRGVRVRPHDKRSMRRSKGLEGALVENTLMTIKAFEPSDVRTHTIAVAGPAALIVAKTHKIAERIHTPRRSELKDAHDVFRLLVAVETQVLAESMRQLLGDPRSRDVTTEAVNMLEDLFAAGPDAPASRMAGEAELGVGEPEQVQLRVSLLAEDLIAALRT